MFFDGVLIDFVAAKEKKKKFKVRQWCRRADHRSRAFARARTTGTRVYAVRLLQPQSSPLAKKIQPRHTLKTRAKPWCVAANPGVVYVSLIIS